MTFDRPAGLITLLVTAASERFGFFATRALLINYAAAGAAHAVTRSDGTTFANPGLEFDSATAAAACALFSGFVHFLAIPGGWVADNLWGPRKAVLVGGLIIATGHLVVAVPTKFTFFLGLACICVGTGLLKPNIVSMVGRLFPEGGARRDTGFSVLYIFINLGALIGPLVSGWLGEHHRWQYGFCAAGLGAMVGMVIYRFGEEHLGGAGGLNTNGGPPEAAVRTKVFFGACCAIPLTVGVGACLVARGAITLSLPLINAVLSFGVSGVLAVYFVSLWKWGGHNTLECRRLGAILCLLLLCAVFSVGFKQSGLSLNWMADSLTDRNLLGWTMPAAFLQAVNPLLVILLGPVFGGLWMWLERRRANPSVFAKAAIGLLSLATGFLVIAFGVADASEDRLIEPSWLVATYFFNTIGELCLSPIGLSAVTKLAPPRRVGQIVGLWYGGIGAGILFAGLIAGRAGSAPAPTFRFVAMLSGAVGLVVLIAAPGMRRLMLDDSSRQRGEKKSEDPS